MRPKAWPRKLVPPENEAAVPVATPSEVSAPTSIGAAQRLIKRGTQSTSPELSAAPPIRNYMSPARAILQHSFIPTFGTTLGPTVKLYDTHGALGLGLLGRITAYDLSNDVLITQTQKLAQRVQICGSSRRLRGPHSYAALRVVVVASTLPMARRILAAIMILVIPPISTDTPTSVPIAQKELEGHLARISIPIKRLATASRRNHPRPSAGSI